MGAPSMQCQALSLGCLHDVCTEGHHFPFAVGFSGFNFSAASRRNSIASVRVANIRLKRYLSIRANNSGAMFMLSGVLPFAGMYIEYTVYLVLTSKCRWCRLYLPMPKPTMPRETETPEIPSGKLTPRVSAVDYRAEAEARGRAA